VLVASSTVAITETAVELELIMSRSSHCTAATQVALVAIEMDDDGSSSISRPVALIPQRTTNREPISCSCAHRSSSPIRSAATRPIHSLSPSSALRSAMLQLRLQLTMIMSRRGWLMMTSAAPFSQLAVMAVIQPRLPHPRRPLSGAVRIAPMSAAISTRSFSSQHNDATRTTRQEPPTASVTD